MNHKVISFIVVAIGFLSFLSFINNKTIYVTGEYSKYCYKLGEHNGNLKRITYYSSLTGCGKPLHN